MLASLQKRSITVSLLGLISQILVKTVCVWPFNCIFWYIMQFESFLERTRLKNDFKENLKFKLKFNKILKFKFKFLPKKISNYFYFWFLICVRNFIWIHWKMTVYKDFRFFTFSLIGFGAQLIGPIQLHVKRQNSSICKFFQDIAWTFFCLWVARSVIHLSKKWKDNLPW